MKLLILDLDGTVRIKKGGTVGEIESGFISSPDDQEIIPGAMSAIKKYHSEGWFIFGASNQGGVAAGHKSLDSCFKEQRHTLEIVELIQTIYFCPDYDGKILGIVDKHGYSEIYRNKGKYQPFRKPSAGMIEFIKNSMLCDSESEFLMVGDRDTDEQCAIAANIPFQWAKDWWC